MRTTSNMWPVTLVFLILLQQGSSYDLNDYYPEVLIDFKFNQDNPECLTQYKKLFHESRSMLARMIDASAKIPPGIMAGRKHIVGDYDECLAIEYDGILGQYCPFTLPYNTNISGSELMLSICIPSGCDLSNVTDKIMKNLCHTRKNYELKAEDYAVSAIFGGLLHVIMVSTMTDVYIDSKKKPRPHPSITAFSILSNVRSFMHLNRQPDQLSGLDGIRFISMAWIIAMHRFATMQAYPLINPDAFEEMKRAWYGFTLQSARVGVDTFFFLSALLFSYLLFKNLEKNAITFRKLPRIYLHRILRILPAMIPLYVIHITVMTKLATGPMWPALSNKLKENCIDHWWSFFSFIQNYVNHEHMCILPTWYLAADMQLYILAPLLIFPLQYLTLQKYSKKITYIVGGVMIILSAVIPYIPDLINKNPNEYTTHQRLGTFMIGLVFGKVMVDVKKQVITLKKIIVSLGWISALSMMLTILLTMAKFDVEYEIGSAPLTAMNAVTRPLWCIGLCWVVFACNTGNGGFINWFLSISYFHYGGKLSYVMYLLHHSLIMVSLSFVRTEHYLNGYVGMYYFCGDFIFTSVVGFAWHLAFEAPAGVFERLLLGKRNKPSQKSGV